MGLRYHFIVGYHIRWIHAFVPMLAACGLVLTLAQRGQAEELTVRNANFAAYAATHDGDAGQGLAVFNNLQKAACAKCHSVDGSQRGVGPDLASIGSKFDRAGLINSVLQPSSAIAIGYGTTTVVTTDGKVVQGVLQRVTDEYIELKNNESQPIRFPAVDIEEQTETATSLMPDGLCQLIEPNEFVDLIAYLQTLRQSPLAGSEHIGDVREIERASVGASLVPWLESAPAWNHPVALVRIPHPAGEFLLLEQGGRIFWIRDAQSTTFPVILDLAQTVRVGGATGLLGAACHPDFERDPRIFIKYQRIESGRITTIVEERRWQSTDGHVELVEPRLLLHIPAVTQDHNGGSIEFGPDGLLYVGMGDSGPQRDPQGHGQDLGTLLGKILRIDVNHRSDALPYGIPANNPFVNRPEARAEVYAYGFREPWRISFDRVTHEMWVGDVGQDRYEEVAIVGRGENHGWNVYEGFNEFSHQYRTTDDSARDVYQSPVLSYPRSLGVSVTGGYVYRGDRSPHMQGWYIFGDFESRRIWALQQQERTLQRVLEIGRLPSRLVSFAEGHDGELICVSYDEGRTYRLKLDDVALTAAHRRVLADTGEQSPVAWRYTTEPPAPDWPSAEFDDSAWRRGPAGFGTRGTPGTVVRTDWHTNDLWIRRSFDADAAMLPRTDETAFLRIHHDDDVEVYLNGEQIAAYDRWTTGYSEFPLTPPSVKLLRTGKNTIAIHCHQNSGGQYLDCGIVLYSR